MMELLYTGAGVAGAAGIGFMHGRIQESGGKGDEGSEAGRAAFQLSRGILDGATAMYFRKHARSGKLAKQVLGPRRTRDHGTNVEQQSIFRRGSTGAR